MPSGLTATCCGVEPTRIGSIVLVVAGLVSTSVLVAAFITDTVPAVLLTTYTRGPLTVWANAIPRGLAPTAIVAITFGMLVVVSITDTVLLP